MIPETKEDKINKAYIYASGYYLTQEFTLEEFNNIDVSNFIKEVYKYAGSSMVREKIIQLANSTLKVTEDNYNGN